ncbi:hypothetical protein [Brevundimonas sp.]|uniref:hypothetical protein n=1 Tax=Brevundimonas sp. TaxID=1871086 RepID=UPI00289D6BFA|nr:hypothetical protein [Brevundimonas sp.]
MIKAKTKPKAKAKAKTLSPEEKARRSLQRRHRKEIRDTFAAAGFKRADQASDKEFKFLDVTTDFDDVFILENVVVLAEYTITKESEISAHAKGKYAIYERINNNKDEFVKFARTAPLNIGSELSEKYSDSQVVVVILYCALNTVKAELKQQITYATFMDYSVVRYFQLLTRTVKQSARSELLAFLRVDFAKFGHQALQNNPSPREAFRGSVLPEGQSKFPPGYKVVSFYINPSALLARAYVLRRDGWRDRNGLYQRMIIRRKLESVRKYLLDSKRVFVNNIIVTLPSGTKVLDEHEDTINPSIITQTQPATISLTGDFNSIGLIDGQHRVFSYYEGGTNEDVISELRSQQNLLVTGIIYPTDTSPEEKTRFEAGLFLEINSNQANAKSDLKQAINQIIRPFLTDSIARDVLDAINDGTGVLAGKFSTNLLDGPGLKTTSVVSYGLRPLVRPVATAPLFSKWDDKQKDLMVSAEDDAARKRYIDYCVGKISVFLAAAKSQLPSDRWTTDRKVADRLITPTVINGLIGAMRQAVEAGVEIEFDGLRSKFAGLNGFAFGKYRSSQYTVMASAIYKEFLAPPAQVQDSAMSEAIAEAED